MLVLALPMLISVGILTGITNGSISISYIKIIEISRSQFVEFHQFPDLVVLPFHRSTSCQELAPKLTIHHFLVLNFAVLMKVFVI
jgi:hypothetical protein